MCAIFVLDEKVIVGFYLDASTPFVEIVEGLKDAVVVPLVSSAHMHQLDVAVVTESCTSSLGSIIHNCDLSLFQVVIIIWVLIGVSDCNRRCHWVKVGRDGVC